MKTSIILITPNPFIMKNYAFTYILLSIKSGKQFLSKSKGLTSLLSLLLFLTAAAPVFSQKRIIDPEQRRIQSKRKVIQNTNVEALKTFAIRSKAASRVAKQEAVTKARRMGWPVREKFEDGSVRELIRLDSRGNPIYYKTFNYEAAITVGTHWLQLGINAYQGEGITIGEWDAGAVNFIHEELKNRINLLDTAWTATNLIDSFEVGKNLFNDHATHVCGTLIGDGSVNGAARGMAPKAEVNDYEWNHDISEMSAEASQGLLISNHSYGSSNGWEKNDIGVWTWWGDTTMSEDYKFGAYQWKARKFDETAFNAPNYLIVQAAGNDRNDAPPTNCSLFGLGIFPVDCEYVYGADTTIYTYSNALPHPKDGNDGYDALTPSGTAKNILTIGAIEKNGETMSSFSGWGPTDDGRIKPDIVAPGVGIISTSDEDVRGTKTMGGTSMASPVVTGSCALLQEAYEEANQRYMLSATLKALVIHTAKATNGAEEVKPNYREGWGMLSAGGAAEVIERDEGNGLHIYEDTLRQYQTYTKKVRSKVNQPLVATIVWTDAAAAASDKLDNPALKLKSDLDMRIIHTETGDVYQPYVLDPANPANDATTGDNFRDNVEKIYIPKGVEGEFTIQITHKNKLSNSRLQAFSLIVTGNQQTNNICENSQPLNCNEPFSGATHWEEDNKVWFSFQGTGAAMTLRFDVEHHRDSPRHSITTYLGTCENLQAELSCWPDTANCTKNTYTIPETLEGETYYASLYGAKINYIVTLECQTNNDCLLSTAIDCGTALIGSTEGSTKATGLPFCGNELNEGVWFKFAGNGLTTTFNIDHPETNFDGRLTLFAGPDCSQLTCLQDAVKQVSVITWPNINYYLYLDGNADETGKYKLTADCAAPTNDDYQNAAPLACGESIAGSTLSAGLENIAALAPCHDLFPNGLGVWYQFTGTGNPVTVSSAGSELDMELMVFENPGPDVLNCEGTNINADGWGITQDQVTVNTRAGLTYKVYVAAHNADGHNSPAGNYKIAISCYTPPIPANDLCENAISLTCGVVVSGNNTDATSDILQSAIDLCYAPSAGVWYKVEGTGGWLTISTDRPNTDFDARLMILYGECGQLQCQAYNNDPAGPRSEATFYASFGSIYYIYVDGYNGETGNFGLMLSCNKYAPANDLCTAAVAINCGETVSGETTYATAQDADQVACFTFNVHKGSWYAFTGTGNVVKLGAEADFDAQLRVYKGACGNFTCIDGMTIINNRTLSVSTEEDADYYVYISGANDYDAGQFSLSLSCESAAPWNDLCSNAIELVCGRSSSGSTIKATNGFGYLINCGNHTDLAEGVWFTFTGNGWEITVSTDHADTDFNTRLRLLQGSQGSCDMLFCLDANDDIDFPANRKSSITFLSEKDKTYFFYLSGYSGATGNYGISLNCAEPPPENNDLCENAIELTCPFADWFGATIGATRTGTEGLTFCDNNTLLNTGVWFRLEGNDKSIELSTDNPNTTFDTRLSVYAGSCGNLSCVAANDNFQEGKYTSRLEFYAKTGTTYFIYLDGKDGAMGNYLLSLFCSDGQPPLPEQNCADTTASYLLFEDDGKSRLYTRSFNGFALGDSPRVDDEFYTSSDNIRGWSWDGSTASYVAVENGESILYTRSFDGNAFASGDLKRFILTENENVRGWNWDGSTASYFLFENGKSHLHARSFDGTNLGDLKLLKANFTSSDNIRGWNWDGSAASYVAIVNGKSILYTRSFDGTTFGQPKRTVLMENENVRGWSWHIDEFDAPCNETSFELTFKVDLSAEGPSPQGVYLAGDFQKLTGYPKDWDPTSIRMDDSDGDGVYTTTIEVTGAEAGRIFSYKFINGTQWEGVPAECGLDDGNGTYNRSLQLPTDGTKSLEVSRCFSTCETTCNSIIDPAEGPDYIVSSFEFINGADPDYIEPGNKFKIEAKIKNVGNRAFDEQTRAFYYLSQDETLDDFDLYLTRDHIKPLGSNDINTDQEYLTIPANTAEGDYFLIYRADAMTEIAETNEENNLRFIPIYVGGRDEVLCDDFENYAPGGIAEQLASDHWVKWSNRSRDGEATSSRASDGGNSLKIQRNNASNAQADVLLRLGDRNSGTYYLSWKMYVPAGKTAYFNMQEDQNNPGSSKFQIIFNAQGVAELRVGSNFREQYDYPQNQWFDMSVLYDPDEDKVIVSLNGDRYAFRSNWRLGAIDFYAIENAEFYVDEFCMIDLNVAQNLQRQAIAKSGRDTTEILIDVQASKDLASIKKSSAGLDTNASLGQNYPNPVEYQTTIPYDVPTGASEMQIRIVSSAGRLIEIIPLQEKGEGKAIFDASRLNEGVFFYSLFLNGRLIDTKRMVKVK